jgi:hypothetical protein
MARSETVTGSLRIGVGYVAGDYALPFCAQHQGFRMKVQRVGHVDRHKSPFKGGFSSGMALRNHLTWGNYEKSFSFLALEYRG